MNQGRDAVIVGAVRTPIGKGKTSGALHDVLPVDWFDAVGLAAYAVFGAAKAIGYGVPPVPAALMGVVTACVGGIIRDVLAAEPSILLRPELYVTAAALAAGSYVALGQFGVPLPVAATAAALAGFALRAAALRWKLALPAYRAGR